MNENIHKQQMFKKNSENPREKLKKQMKLLIKAQNDILWKEYQRKILMELLDKALNKTIDKALEAKNHDEVIAYLKKEMPGSINTKCDVRHLWGNNYRINYWGLKEGEQEIIDSKFVVVNTTKDGFVTTVK